MDNNAITEKLLDRYDSLFKTNLKSGQPDWAVMKNNEPERLVHPTIPFVGKNYCEQKLRIMLYASAENLNNYSGHLDNDDMAIDRHRRYYEESAVKNYFFPMVHIAPMEDGCLMNVLKYVSERMGLSLPDNPREFLECIAFGNFCKFSIRSQDHNIDYAKDKPKLNYSIPYVLSDLELLKPDVVIMPATIYKTVKQEISKAISNTLILPIYQINAGTINRTISKNYPPKEVNDLSPVTQQWYLSLGDVKNKKVAYANHIAATTKSNFLSVFSYLDVLLAASKRAF